MTEAEIAAFLRDRIEATKAGAKARNFHPSEPAWHRAFGRLSAYNEILGKLDTRSPQERETP